MSLMLQCLFASLCGILSHSLVFVRGEHDRQAGSWAKSFVALTISLPIFHWMLLNETLQSALHRSCSILAAFAATVALKILLYRVLFSPLHHIKGPFALRVSKLYHLWQIRKFDNFRYMQGLHLRYGDMVRTGPNEVTFFNVEAFYDIHGLASQCTRTVYYEAFRPIISLVTIRDPAGHADRRKLWDRALSREAVRAFSPYVHEHVIRVIDQLQSSHGQNIEVSKLFEAFAFDVIGAVGFGVDFGLLQGESHFVSSRMQQLHKSLGWTTPTPWLFYVVGAIPFSKDHFNHFVSWVRREVVRSQLNTGTHGAKRTILSYLSKGDVTRGGEAISEDSLIGEVLLLLAAAVHPISQALTKITYYLASQPKHIDQIYCELENNHDLANSANLRTLTHLNAVINEAFRLNPAVPANVPRLAPKGGLPINGIFIPEDTTLVTPHYTLFRREEYFDRPLEFVPERFTTHPELIRNISAWRPWGIGHYNCAGKEFGLMEIRVIIASLVKSFHFELARGEDGSKMFEDTKDHFAAVSGPLNVVFTPRSNYPNHKKNN